MAVMPPNTFVAFHGDGPAATTGLAPTEGVGLPVCVGVDPP